MPAGRVEGVWEVWAVRQSSAIPIPCETFPTTPCPTAAFLPFFVNLNTLHKPYPYWYDSSAVQPSSSQATSNEVGPDSMLHPSWKPHLKIPMDDVE